jgi:hypothetical protein
MSVLFHCVNAGNWSEWEKDGETRTNREVNRRTFIMFGCGGVVSKIFFTVTL